MDKPHYRCDRCDCRKYIVLSNKDKRICCKACKFEGYVTIGKVQSPITKLMDGNA